MKMGEIDVSVTFVLVFLLSHDLGTLQIGMFWLLYIVFAVGVKIMKSPGIFFLLLLYSLVWLL